MGKADQTSDDNTTNTAKSAPAFVAPAPAQAVPAAEAETLNEFCTRLSVTDKRVELIGAFHASERQANRVKDTQSAYQARYAAFATQPA